MMKNIEQKVQNAPGPIFRRPHRLSIGRIRCGWIRVALARRKGTVFANDELGPKLSPLPSLTTPDQQCKKQEYGDQQQGDREIAFNNSN